MADSEVVLVETGRTVASVDFRSEDGVEGTNGASSLEGEVSVTARKSADSATVERVSSSADALTVGDDLVGSAGEAVAHGVKNFVRLALTDAAGALENFALRTSARVAADDDHSLGTDRAESVDDETVGKFTARSTDSSTVVGKSCSANASSTDKLLVGAAVGAA